jgi:CheY-like chemotaxis protein
MYLEKPDIPAYLPVINPNKNKLMKSGPIILIEDDADDKDIFAHALDILNIKNELIWFANCMEAFEFLKTTSKQPFIIFCDVNLPQLSGINFKRQVDDDPELRKKSIPFLFYSTSIDQETVNEAYTQMTVQGFFQKKHSIEEITNSLKIIVDYWQHCRHPNLED